MTKGTAYMLVTTKDGQRRRASALYFDHVKGKTFALLASDVPGYQGDYVEVQR